MSGWLSKSGACASISIYFFHTTFSFFRFSVNRTSLVISINDAFFDVHMFSVAEVFIGNCVSSLTAIARRMRDGNGVKTDYWGLV